MNPAPGRRSALAVAMVGLAVFAALTAGTTAVAHASSSAGRAAPPRVQPVPHALRQGALAFPRTAGTLGPLPARTSLRLTLTLGPRDPAGLQSLAEAVSNPSSPEHGHYITPSQFAARFGASAARIAQVRRQLAADGIGHVSVARDGLSVSFSTSAATAERAFHTRLGQARLADGRIAYANTAPATVPLGASGILGLQNLYVAHAEDLTAKTVSASALPPTACSNAQSPFVNPPSGVASAYGLDPLYSAGQDGSGITVALFELGDFSNSDIGVYASCYGLGTPSITRIPVDGGAAVGNGTIETTADVEDLMTYAPDASIQVYEGPNSSQGLYDTYAAIINADQAQVVSTSWGVCEAENDPSLMRAENVLFQQAAAQGQTMLAASGDSGSEDCYLAGVDSNSSLQVDDPSSQPFVTGVGGTSLSSTSPRVETVWNSDGGAGGGGISSMWPLPSWQASSVYSDSSGAPCGATSGYCRQVPDVSASADPGHGFAAYCTAGDCQGQGWGAVGGTSVASPLLAAIVALSDQACPTSNRAGFINPVLYGPARSTFHDITSGNNDLLGIHNGTYTARVGYDMASGLGSPDAGLLAPYLCAPANTTPTTTTTTTSTTTTTTPTTTTSTTSPTTTTTSGGSGGSTPAGPPAPAQPGYRFVAADGGVFDYGAATYQGSAAGHSLDAPVLAMAEAPDGNGYWLVTATGQVLSYGSAQNYGSAAASQLNSPIVGMAATPDGLGYWLVSADGGVYSFGDAHFYGSAADLHLAAGIVGMAADPATGGYWLVAADGGVFSYNAPFYGSTGNLHLAKPIVGMSAMPDGGGYRFVASDGGIFDFGDARFYGSAATLHLAKPVVGMATTPDGLGYWLVAADGGIFTYGDAPFLGSAGNLALAAPIVGMAGL